MSREIALFDLDGTLADNSHRQSLVTGSKKDWDAFFEAQVFDTPNQAVVGLFRALEISEQYDLIVATARPERYRAVTLDWLAKHGIKPFKLVMRIDGDRRSDEIIKREILQNLRCEGLDPLFVVDDRSSVVRMWRSEGVTCFQCADHDY